MDWLPQDLTPKQKYLKEKNISSWEGAAHSIPNAIWEHNDSILSALRLMEQAQVL